MRVNDFSGSTIGFKGIVWMSLSLPRLDGDGRRLKVADDEEPSGRVRQDLGRLLHDDEGAHRPTPRIP